MCCNHIGINSSTHGCKSIPRCQERQSGGTECKKNFQRPGLCPDPPPLGGVYIYSASPDSLAGGKGDWLPPLQLPPAVGPLDLASPVPHTKIVPGHLILAGDAPESHIGYD